MKPQIASKSKYSWNQFDAIKNKLISFILELLDDLFVGTVESFGD